MEEGYKIIQMISCDRNIYAKFKVEDNDLEKKANPLKPIVAFALVEYRAGLKEVIPMCINESGEIFCPIGCSDFEEILI